MNITWAFTADARARNAREALTEERSCLKRAITGRQAMAQAGPGDCASDTLDVASVWSQLGTEATLCEHLMQRLEQNSRATHRVEEGVYGTCEACQEEIPIARLRALPSATRCRRCQENVENSRRNRRPKGPGPPTEPASTDGFLGFTYAEAD